MTFREIILISLLFLGFLFYNWRVKSIKRIGKKRTRKRIRHAQKGERDARSFLEAKGFRIEEEQASAEGCFFVDDEEWGFEVRIDILARKGRRKYLIEVKTGSKAVSPSAPQTRRQLREYADIFPDREILLLDMEQKKLMHIEF